MKVQLHMVSCKAGLKTDLTKAYGTNTPTTATSQPPMRRVLLLIGLSYANIYKELLNDLNEKQRHFSFGRHREKPWIPWSTW